MFQLDKYINLTCTHSTCTVNQASVSNSTHHSISFVDCTCGDDDDDDDGDDDDDSIDFPWNPIHLLVDQLHLLPGNHQTENCFMKYDHTIISMMMMVTMMMMMMMMMTTALTTVCLQGGR